MYGCIMNRIVLSILAIAACLAGAFAAVGLHYVNARYGYAIDLPPGFSAIDEAGNGDGGTSRFDRRPVRDRRVGRQPADGIAVVGRAVPHAERTGRGLDDRLPEGHQQTGELVRRKGRPHLLRPRHPALPRRRGRLLPARISRGSARRLRPGDQAIAEGLQADRAANSARAALPTGRNFILRTAPAAARGSPPATPSSDRSKPRTPWRLPANRPRAASSACRCGRPASARPDRRACRRG